MKILLNYLHVLLTINFAKVMFGDVCKVYYVLIIDTTWVYHRYIICMFLLKKISDKRKIINKLNHNLVN